MRDRSCRSSPYITIRKNSNKGCESLKGHIRLLKGKKGLKWEVQRRPLFFLEEWANPPVMLLLSTSTSEIFNGTVSLDKHF
jgi:hypothetical protein